MRPPAEDLFATRDLAFDQTIKLLENSIKLDIYHGGAALQGIVSAVAMAIACQDDSFQDSPVIRDIHDWLDKCFVYWSCQDIPRPIEPKAFSDN